MLVVDQTTLSELAKAFRRNLAAEGIKLGHQSSLNLCIAALGLGSPNKVAAILTHRPLLLDWPLMAGVSPGMQLAKLAVHEAAAFASRLPGTGQTTASETGPASLTRSQSAGLLAAACMMARLAVAAEDTPYGAEVLLLEHVVDLPRFPMLLTLVPSGQARGADAVASAGDIAERLHAGMSRAAIPGLAADHLAGRFAAAVAQASQAATAQLDCYRWPIDTAASRWLRTEHPSKHDDGQRLATAVLASFAHHGSVGVLWPDLRVESLVRFLPGWTLDVAVQDARVPNATTQAAMLEARDMTSRLRPDAGGSMTADRMAMLATDAGAPGNAMLADASKDGDARYCLGQDSLEGRIGRHLFSETRDGQLFHTFDFGTDPETADLMEGEFTWLEPSTNPNASVRHALFGLAGCGLDSGEGRALKARIDAFLATDIQHSGVEAAGLVLLRQAVALVEAEEGLDFAADARDILDSLEAAVPSPQPAMR